MSRTRLAALTALGLMIVSVAVFFTRRATGGVDVGALPGASAWEVSITARGTLERGKTTTVTASAPPSFRKQHVFEESWDSDELTRRESRTDPAKANYGQEVVWRYRPPPMVAPQGGNYRLTYNFHCVLGAHRTTNLMRDRTQELDKPPTPHTDGTESPAPRIESDAREIHELAQEQAGPRTAPIDLYRQFHDHVTSLEDRDTGGAGSALDCLRHGGDDAGRSRLLVALCRNRKIPARVVTGLVLNPNAPPTVHHWVEAFIRGVEGPDGHWIPACPTYGHFGARAWPANYLVVRLDDEPLVRGPGDPKVTLFARPLTDKPAADEPAQKRFWRAISLASLPPAEQHLAQFLLLLPLATVIVSFLRVVVGVRTYGVFSPALLGLIFRDLQALPWGLGIFAGTVVVGWVFRKLLDRYHLLLIPRSAVLLSMVVAFLLVVIVVTARLGVQITGYVALFPLIILTHMVERFWTVEAEDGTRSSFKTLIGTMLVAVAVALALSPDAVGRWMARYPETLGVVVAVLLLLGRYTGYRLTELYRFQDVIEFQNEAAKATPAEKATPAVVLPAPGLDGVAAAPPVPAASLPAPQPEPVPGGGS